MEQINWVLAAVVVILLLSVLRGVKEGLVESLFFLVSTVAVIIMTLLLKNPVEQMLRGIPFVSELVETAAGEIGRIFFYPAGSGADTEFLYMTNRDILESGFPEIIRGFYLAQIEKAENFISSGSVSMTAALLYAILAYLTAFTVLAAARMALYRTLDIVSRLPVVSQLNALAGGAVGFIKGIIWVWLFFMTLTLFSGTEAGVSAVRMIQSEELLLFLYDNNLILKLLQR